MESLYLPEISVFGPPEKIRRLNFNLGRKKRKTFSPKTSSLTGYEAKIYSRLFLPPFSLLLLQTTRYPEDLPILGLWTHHLSCRGQEHRATTENDGNNDNSNSNSRPQTHHQQQITAGEGGDMKRT